MKKGFKLTKGPLCLSSSRGTGCLQQSIPFPKKVAGTTDVDLAALDAEVKTRQAQDAASQAMLESTKGDLEQLRNVRYYVCKVMPDKIEPKSVREKLAAGKTKADRENAERNAQQTQRKQNIEL